MAASLMGLVWLLTGLPADIDDRRWALSWIGSLSGGLREWLAWFAGLLLLGIVGALVFARLAEPQHVRGNTTDGEDLYPFARSEDGKRFMRDSARHGEQWLRAQSPVAAGKQYPLPRWADERAISSLELGWRTETLRLSAMIKGAGFEQEGGGILTTGAVVLTNRTNKKMRLTVELIVEPLVPFTDAERLSFPAMTEPPKDEFPIAHGEPHLAPPIELPPDGGGASGYLSFLVPASHYFLAEQAGVDLTKGFTGMMYVHIQDDMGGGEALFPLGSDYPYRWWEGAIPR